MTGHQATPTATCSQTAFNSSFTSIRSPSSTHTYRRNIHFRPQSSTSAMAAAARDEAAYKRLRRGCATAAVPMHACPALLLGLLWVGIIEHRSQTANPLAHLTGVPQARVCCECSVHGPLPYNGPRSCKSIPKQGCTVTPKHHPRLRVTSSALPTAAFPTEVDHGSHDPTRAGANRRHFCR